jgi:hypothetical protein
MTKEVMQQALEALRMPCEFWNKTQFIKVTEAIKALEKALKQEQDDPVGEVSDHDWSTGLLYRDLEPGTPLYTKPQQRKPLTDDEFLELLLRNGNSELLHYTTFVGGSIQMQGKIGLLKSAKVIKEFIEECYGIKE